MVRSKTVRKRVRDTEPNPDTLNFISLAAYKLYKNLDSRPIITEKGFDHAGLVVFNILALFQAVGWAGILDMTDPVLEDLVRVFYANFHFESNQGKSRCRGVPITLSTHTMAIIIQCQNEGEERYFDDWPADFDRERIENDIEFVFGRRMVREALVNAKASDMPLIHHLVHHILVYNVIPKGGHWNAVKPLEVYLISRIMKGEKVNLPYLILQHMRFSILSKRESSLLYGRLITKIIDHFNIPFQGEKESLHIRPTYDIINKGTLKRMGYMEVENEWILKEKSSEKSKKPRMSGEGTSSATPETSIPLEDEVKHIKFKLDIALNSLAEMSRRYEAQEECNRSMQRTLQAVHNMLVHRQPHQEQPEPEINVADILRDLDPPEHADPPAPSTAGPSSSTPQHSSPPSSMYF